MNITFSSLDENYDFFKWKPPYIILFLNSTQNSKHILLKNDMSKLDGLQDIHIWKMTFLNFDSLLRSNGTP